MELPFGTRVRISENSRHETAAFPTAVIVGEGIHLFGHEEEFRYFAVFENSQGGKNVLAKLYTNEIAEVIEVLPIQEAATIYRSAK